MNTAPQKETLLIEMLLGGLDLRAQAGALDSPRLVYLADLLVLRTREELDLVSQRVERRRLDAASGDPVA